MLQVSYSKVDCFVQCPYKYKLKYIKKLKCYDDYEPTNPLTLGIALHKGIESDVKRAIDEYLSSYPIVTDKHYEEVIKLEILIPRVKELLEEKFPNGKHEVEIRIDNFVGYIDYLYPLEDGSYGIIDFKYSNAIEKYSKSGQLHVYKHKVEQALNINISELKFLFIPKIAPRQKKTECLGQFRRRIFDTLNSKSIEVLDIPYDITKVDEFRGRVREMNDINEFMGYFKSPSIDYVKRVSDMCKWCDYYDYCTNGNDLNIIKEDEIMLPSTSRVSTAQANFVKLWIYGEPFSGKTTLVDSADVPLNLNSDGNVKYVSMPRLAIKDIVSTNGRLTNRKYAWEVFTEAIDDLEKGSEFKTIVVDLVEDMYDYCRVYMCEKNNWEHESDDSFKAYDIVRSEFLRNIKRLMNLPYNIVLISHEDKSRDIMTRDKKVTAVKPNIQDKLALKLAGMVDLVCRVVVESDDSRKLTFKSDNVVFGGGRLQNNKYSECELSWEALMKVYKDVTNANKPLTAHMEKVKAFKEEAHANANANVETVETVNVDNVAVEDEQMTAEEVKVEETTPTAPARRTRRSR